jgi:hypothetical protein
MNINSEKKVDSLKKFNYYVKKKCFKKAIHLAQHFRIKGVMISKGTIKSNYPLTNKQISSLQYVEIDNPYYKCAGAMKLYLIAQIEHLLNKQQISID